MGFPPVTGIEEIDGIKIGLGEFPRFGAETTMIRCLKYFGQQLIGMRLPLTGEKLLFWEL